MFDPSAKVFNTSALVAAAGCEIGTFHKWRERNGLFPETRGASGWSKFSVIDICVVRIIVVLTMHRLSADLAIRASQFFGEQHLAGLFNKGLTNRRYVSVYPGDPSADWEASFTSLRDQDTLDEVMRASAGAAMGRNDATLGPLSGVATIIDLAAIVLHVVQRLVLLDLDVGEEQLTSLFLAFDEKPAIAAPLQRRLKAKKPPAKTKRRGK